MIALAFRIVLVLGATLGTLAVTGLAEPPRVLAALGGDRPVSVSVADRTVAGEAPWRLRTA